MKQHDAINPITGLTIGQRWADDARGFTLRIVAIDPHLRSMEAEAADGALVLDTIEHFTTTHRAVDWPLAV